MPAAAAEVAVAASPSRPCRAICISAPGNWSERSGPSERRGRSRPQTGSVRAAAKAAEAGVSHRRGDGQEGSQDRGGGLQAGKGAASKTRIWSPRGLRGRGLHLAAPQNLGGGNRGAAKGGFPCRVCQTKGTSLLGRSMPLSLSLSSLLWFPLSLSALPFHSPPPPLLSALNLFTLPASLRFSSPTLL